MNANFLPVSKQDMAARGWEDYDFLLITGDAYVDHPSFGPTIIGRMLEGAGFRVAILAQPDWRKDGSLAGMGRPRLGVFISAGNLDSMVAHYTVAKRKRSEDAYSPGNQAGLRPDRATIVYSTWVRRVWRDIPIVIGGLEASLRRFAHYDYWEDKVRPSILFDSRADLLVYGMGETATREIAQRLKSGEKVENINNVKGTAFTAETAGECVYPSIKVPGFELVSQEKKAYARANMTQYHEHDPIRGQAVIQPCGDRFLVVNPPAMPLTTQELDEIFELPYTREPHPMYEAKGGVAAIEEVRFSVIHNRGCFGACNFCSLAFHQGRIISSRSQESVVAEVEELTRHPGFKGYIHDVGGPTANLRRPACKKQLKAGLCTNRACLAPTPCPSLDADHSDYLELLRKLREVPGVKKVFIRSGIRYDYMMADKSGAFFSDLVKHHVSGQLKVAPEHCVAGVLDYMGKPHIDAYESFKDRYQRYNQKFDKEQYIVPYLMSSHPGCTLGDAVKLAEWLSRTGRQPEQVQDFYPTPGTLSTCMYYTGLDPRTMEPVFVPKTPHEKAMQRALMQWKRPEKRPLVMEALRAAHREDLIGFEKRCLVRPERTAGQGYSGGKPEGATASGGGRKSSGPPGRGVPKQGKAGAGKGQGKQQSQPVPTKAKPVNKSGWAKAKPRVKVQPRRAGK